MTLTYVIKEGCSTSGAPPRGTGCLPDMSATISFIAPKAEYTPPVIYSESTRAKFVFLAEQKPPKCGHPLQQDPD